MADDKRTHALWRYWLEAVISSLLFLLLMVNTAQASPRASDIAYHAQAMALSPADTDTPASTVTDTPPADTSTPTNTETYTYTPTSTPTVTPIYTPTYTPIPASDIIIGHLNWQGIFQPDGRNRGITVPLTLCSAGAPHNYLASTDDSGFFTITTGLPDGTYDWWLKGVQWIAASGTLTMSGTTQAEFDQQKPGDANNDNVINVLDFNILKFGFSKGPGQYGWDDRPNFNHDGVVNSTDFNLMKNNYAHSGPPPNCPTRR